MPAKGGQGATMGKLKGNEVIRGRISSTSDLTGKDGP